MSRLIFTKQNSSTKEEKFCRVTQQLSVSLQSKKTCDLFGPVALQLSQPVIEMFVECGFICCL